MPKLPHYLLLLPDFLLFMKWEILSGIEAYDDRLVRRKTIEWHQIKESRFDFEVFVYFFIIAKFNNNWAEILFLYTFS